MLGLIANLFSPHRFGSHMTSIPDTISPKAPLVLGVLYPKTTLYALSPNPLFAKKEVIPFLTRISHCRKRQRCFMLQLPRVFLEYSIHPMTTLQ